MSNIAVYKILQQAYSDISQKPLFLPVLGKARGINYRAVEFYMFPPQSPLLWPGRSSQRGYGLTWGTILRVE